MWGNIFVDIGLLCVIVVVVVSRWIYKWQNPRCNGNLPPGSMGLPLIGETLEFFTPQSSNDIPPFIKKRVARYGTVFKTNLVGRNIIVSTDPEINHQIFQQEEKSFMLCYTDSFTEISGKDTFLGTYGMIHKYLKNLALELVKPENLRDKMLPEMDEAARVHLRSWASRGIVDVKDVASNMIFDYFAKKLINYDEAKATKKLKDNYNAFMDGLISFPLNIPGTAYHACIQGRKNATKVIKDIFDERKASNANHGDFLDHLLEELKKEDTIMNEKMAINFIFLLLFAAHETTSIAITLGVKFITDNPEVLAELTKEHEKIIEKRHGKKGSEITWQEYKSMTFTHMVINETVRIANIVPAVFRRPIKDVKMKGYLIPKGWLVMVVPSVLHMDPKYYDDPFTFNPRRWTGKKLHVGSKTFMAFGGGIRVCVGADFAKLQMAIVIHYLVLNYRWAIIKGGEIIRKPGVIFPNGLHVKISENA